MIRGQTRPLTIETTPENLVSMGTKANIHNRFDIEIVDAITGEVRQKAYAENIILDSYWNYLLAGSVIAFHSIAYGTGTGTLSPSRTTLFAKSAQVAMTGITTTRDNVNRVFSVKGGIVLGTDVANGLTLTEVGIAIDSAYGGTLLTHAMLKDMNGNQISITKTATDVINIYATVFLHWCPSFDAFNARDIFMKWIIGAIGSDGGYSGDGFHFKRGASDVNKGATFTHDATSKTCTITSLRITQNEGNYPGGINTIAFRRYQLENDIDIFSITLPNTDLLSGYDVVGEAIGTGNGSTVDFLTDFPCVTNATIYVDGVAQSPTVDNSTALTNNIHFAVAPAIGAAITGNYHTTVIPKDVNHVFDFSMTFQLGEYTT